MIFEDMLTYNFYTCLKVLMCAFWYIDGNSWKTFSSFLTRGNFIALHKLEVIFLLKSIGQCWSLLRFVAFWGHVFNKALFVCNNIFNPESPLFMIYLPFKIKKLNKQQYLKNCHQNYWLQTRHYSAEWYFSASSSESAITCLTMSLQSPFFIGWNHQETIDSLLRKGGYKGPITEAMRASVHLTRYRSDKMQLHASEYFAEQTNGYHV